MTDIAHRAEQAAPEETRELLLELRPLARPAVFASGTFMALLDIDTPEAHLAAAMMLVPAGMTWGIFGGEASDKPQAWLWPDAKRNLLSGVSCDATTPALALIAAVARLQEQTP